MSSDRFLGMIRIHVADETAIAPQSAESETEKEIGAEEQFDFESTVQFSLLSMCREQKKAA